ncbi:hypothetical protein [Rheinheimera sp.]|uniref:hypothetical protein n=1 Tax=Rheinheimera sp. TaxID=1869214 RepID=UPI002737314E|nr:hypothetical protein [Rheinheimera sp.]MDP2715548.1 hypothetical protein [Rheinheimera sp.]
MKIILSPHSVFEQDTPPQVRGELITYRGETYDLSQLPEGAIVEADSPFIGQITRINGEIHLKLEYRYNTNLAEDNQSTNWSDYTFNVTNGQCPDPIVYKPVAQEPENVD